ncbi:MAG: ABC transporter ATP-binding protein, partial [Candidatus Competibacterales bacterium]|nr:ABC transporter ATP-binding protein [Candidatus Competibacterales bacterium]
AVNECSFEIESGSITGLIGPNGAGKTTLFNMIAGLFPPDSGRIEFYGRDVTGLPAHQLFHLGIVRTFQIPHEFARMTVLDNLALVPAGQSGENLFAAWFGGGRVRRQESRIRRQAEEVLDFLNLRALRDEKAGNLSGGQKKLLELGRTMMTEPRLVLLDEPAAGVNRTLLGTLNEAIVRLNRERGYTFCIVEHDMDMVTRLCDPVIVMAEGTVLTQGRMDEIMRNPQVLEAYMGSTAHEEPA